MAELVGGALLSASFQILFSAINSGAIIDFFKRTKQAQLLEKLKVTLLSVEVVLDDAEMKQLRSPSIKNWLEGLKDAAEDAENLLDEISTDALEVKILSAESGTTRFSTGVKGFFYDVFDSRGRDRKAEMEKILARLEYISSQKDILGLNIANRERLSRRLPSSSVVEVSEVYGREADRAAVKKLVLSDSAETIFVIPIVGMGGVGKTTLAQALFNDDEVQKKFDVKAWVCVSEEFDVCKVTKTVIEAVTDLACDAIDLNTLQVKLKTALKEKKFLVVLDDVWNEKYEDWVVLTRPFHNGAKGSKMIVTTRNEKVASVMGSSPSHHLNILSDEDCWDLFAKHASGNRDFTKDAKLEAIGRKIVKKCKGLPLAAKTLGGLLRSTLDVGEWERVLGTDIWDFKDQESNIIPALRVSYYYLPSHLKRCFAHCSMFPKDYTFHKEALVFLWMAENLLCQSKGSKRMEDVGDEYFNDLVSRSFFQRMSNNHKSWFVMHDLLVDLAKYVSSNSVHFHGVESSSEYVTKLRHLTIFYENRGPHDWVKFNLLEATRLRTFHQLLSDGNIPDKVVQDIPLKFKCLRSLTLHDISTLPDSIGELKHLRYLDLRESSITELPESVCGLYNLQTLRLSPCKNLKRLPRYMHRLINLRCLSIDKWLVEMPTHMSKLKNLQTLSVFVVSEEDDRRICELKELLNLRGSLCIKNLRNLVDPRDALEAKLMDKKYLRELLLEWGDGDTDDTAHEKLVLGNLTPSTTIACIEINNYGGMLLPEWVGDRTYDNIVKLKLLNCKFCISLPPLGLLSSLETLTIQGFQAIETVDHGFYGNSAFSSMNPFPLLKMLELYDMSNWNEWLPMHTCDVIAFPKLEILRITNCPELIGNFPDSFPSLIVLEIEKCGSMNCSLPTMPALQAMQLDGCDSLATLGPLPATLKALSITGCEKLEFPFSHGSLEDLAIIYSYDSIQCFPLNSFTSLTKLTLYGLKNIQSMSVFDGSGQDMGSLSKLSIGSCPNFVSFPPGGFSAPKLTSIMISRCKKFKCWPDQMHTRFSSLQYLEIKGCPEVESFPQDGLPSNLRRITVEDCDKLIASRSSWNLTRLTKLEYFGIHDSSEIRCFPEKGLLPTSITHLFIGWLSSLETVDVNGLRQLTSLKKLEMWFCENLRTIPVQELPNSLERLDIFGCRLLVEQSDELKKQIRECPNNSLELLIK